MANFRQIVEFANNYTSMTKPPNSVRAVRGVEILIAIISGKPVDEESLSIAGRALYIKPPISRRMIVAKLVSHELNGTDMWRIVERMVGVMERDKYKHKLSMDKDQP